MKERHLRLFALMVALLFITAGCNAKQKTEEVTQEPATVAEENALFHVEEKIEGNFDKKLVKEGKQQGLCEVLEKKNASAQAKYNGVNRMHSADLERNQQSLFCIDKDTGVVYFINQNQDWYIYRLKEGIAELAVALPAKELWIWDGIVYFMIESYDMYEMKDFTDGDIYAYAPGDGSVTLVYAAGKNLGTHINRMTVNEDGIYCGGRIIETIEFAGNKFQEVVNKSYYLPFNGKEVTEDNYHMTQAGYGDYLLAFTRDMESYEIVPVLYNRYNFTEAAKKELSIGKSNLCCIMNDRIYCISDFSFVIKNLITEEERRISFKEVLESNGCMAVKEINGEQVTVSVGGFTLTEDYAWVEVAGKYLIRIGLKDDEVLCYKLNAKQYSLGTLYTDGENIYALLARDGEKLKRMACILVEAVVGEEKIYGTPLLDTEYLIEK